MSEENYRENSNEHRFDTEILWMQLGDDIRMPPRMFIGGFSRAIHSVRHILTNESAP